MSINSVEAHFIDRARTLTEQGQSLEILTSLPALEQWDEAVNRLLQEINDELTEGFSSLTLKLQLDGLTQLYLAILARVTELQQQNDENGADLIEIKRRARGR